MRPGRRPTQGSVRREHLVARQKTTVTVAGFLLDAVLAISLSDVGTGTRKPGLRR